MKKLFLLLPLLILLHSKLIAQEERVWDIRAQLNTIFYSTDTHKKTYDKAERYLYIDQEGKIYTVSTGTMSFTDPRYTVKGSTATIKYFITSTTYTSPYPINSFSIVCFGEGAKVSSNVGDIKDIPFIDGFGVSTELDQPKSSANFIFTLQPNTTVYLTTR